MVTNSSGMVGMVNKQPVQKYVKVGSNEYVFTVNRAISFAWINPGDVDQILAIKGCNCPNSSNTSVFSLANEAQERIWSGRSER